MRHFLSLAAVLAVLWLGLSGVYTPVVLSLGAVSVLLVLWLSARMEVVGIEHNPVLFSWRLPIYWLWLVWQVVLANVHVASLVLQPKRLRPRVFRSPVPHHSEVARVTYANSITLTPGTITLRLRDDHIEVHAIDEISAAGVHSGEMAARVGWLEGMDGSGS